MLKITDGQIGQLRAIDDARRARGLPGFGRELVGFIAGLKSSIGLPYYGTANVFISDVWLQELRNLENVWMERNNSGLREELQELISRFNDGSLEVGMFPFRRRAAKMVWSLGLRVQGCVDFRDYLDSVPEPPEVPDIPNRGIAILVDPRFDTESHARAMGFWISEANQYNILRGPVRPDTPYWMICMVAGGEVTTLRPFARGGWTVSFPDTQATGLTVSEGLAVVTQRPALFMREPMSGIVDKSSVFTDAVDERGLPACALFDGARGGPSLSRVAIREDDPRYRPGEDGYDVYEALTARAIEARNLRVPYRML